MINCSFDLNFFLNAILCENWYIQKISNTQKIVILWRVSFYVCVCVCIIVCVIVCVIVWIIVCLSCVCVIDFVSFWVLSIMSLCLALLVFVDVSLCVAVRVAVCVCVCRKDTYTYNKTIWYTLYTMTYTTSFTHQNTMTYKHKLTQKLKSCILCVFHSNWPIQLHIQKNTIRNTMTRKITQIYAGTHW